MKDNLKATYEYYENKLQELFNEVSLTKEMLNRLAKDLGMAVPYPDTSTEKAGGSMIIKPGQFYTKPLATAVREYLQMKNEPASWDEIVEVLNKGNFEFEKNPQETRLTILRNTGNFVLIGGEYIGLKEWYPKKKKRLTDELFDKKLEGKSEKEE
jgi:hypothetical protein